MNQQQRKYTVKRMDTMANEAIHRLRPRFVTEPVKLTLEDKWKQIKNGTAKLITKAELKAMRQKGWVYIDDFYSFKGEVEGGFDDENFLKEKAKIIKALDKAKDETMLGDSKEALKLLKDFTSLCNSIK
jgi:hypothetical protein